MWEFISHHFEDKPRVVELDEDVSHFVEFLQAADDDDNDEQRRRAG